MRAYTIDAVRDMQDIERSNVLSQLQLLTQQMNQLLGRAEQIGLHVEAFAVEVRPKRFAVAVKQVIEEQ